MIVQLILIMGIESPKLFFYLYSDCLFRIFNLYFISFSPGTISHIFQKYFARFRITTNGGQCISCGNCSTYCEMGIDVKACAQRGQDIVRASCVGCGICAAVCPRGVLRLENGSEDISERATELRALHITKEGVTMN